MVFREWPFWTGFIVLQIDFIMEANTVHSVCNIGYLMLGLHYVPGSHGSQKRSLPWCFSHFCLCVQVLLSLAMFSHGLSRYAVTEALWRATVCH